MPVFLYNYSDRTMHGIFKAVSEGSLEINPKGKSHEQHPQLHLTILHCWLLAEPWVLTCRMDNLSKPAHPIPSSGAGGGVQPVPCPK